MQLTGHAGRHLSQPLHSSGRMTTSGPWLKIAPKCDGQCRRHASQLMHSSISMRTGGFFHLGLRVWCSMRSARVDPMGAKCRHDRLTRGSSGCSTVVVTEQRTHTEQGLERKQQL